MFESAARCFRLRSVRCKQLHLHGIWGWRAVSSAEAGRYKPLELHGGSTHTRLYLSVSKRSV